MKKRSYFNSECQSRFTESEDLCPLSLPVSLWSVTNTFLYLSILITSVQIVLQIQLLSLTVPRHLGKVSSNLPNILAIWLITSILVVNISHCIPFTYQKPLVWHPRGLTPAAQQTQWRWTVPVSLPYTPYLQQYSKGKASIYCSPNWAPQWAA